MLLGLLSAACQSSHTPHPEPHLSGTGIVTGLHHSGANSPAAIEAVLAFASDHGLTVHSSDIAPGSVALVHLSCALPATVRAGQKADLHCEAVDADVSLRGGTLLRVDLRDQDGTVWAVAQGRVEISNHSTIPADAPPTPMKSGWVMQGAVFLRDR